MPRFTAKRFRELLEQLELGSQEQAAEQLGIGVRSLIRYEQGHAKVPAYLRRLMLLWAEHGPMTRSKEW